MKRLFKVAEQFSQGFSKVAAGRKTRKQLEKDLSYAKDFYVKHKSQLDLDEKRFKDLEAALETQRKNVEKAKKDIHRAYDTMKNMDIYDVGEIRFFEDDDVAYVRNNRLFRLKDSELVPYKKKEDASKEDSSEETSDQEETDDSDVKQIDDSEADDSEMDELSADDLLKML